MDDADGFARAILATLGAGLACGLALVAYVAATHEPDEAVARRTETFTLAGVRPPKHFMVDLRDAGGTVHPELYVSKHCNAWRSLVVGQRLDLEVVTYRKPGSRGGGTYERILTGENRICPAS